LYKIGGCSKKKRVSKLTLFHKSIAFPQKLIKIAA